MAIGTPAVGSFMGQMHLIVNHINGTQFYFYPVSAGPAVGVMPTGSQAEQEALMQAMVTALDGHPDLTVQLAAVVYDAGATITP
jgi:hypothetical protein